jgi:RNA polymerase sigma factor (sigma-70 family)
VSSLTQWADRISNEDLSGRSPLDVFRRRKLIRVVDAPDDLVAYAVRIREGDHDAFTAFVQEHYESVLRVAMSVVKSKETALDIAQDLFVRLWERREELTPDKLTASYLMAAAYNRGLDALKIHRVRAAHREVIQAEAIADPERLATPSHEARVLSHTDFSAAMDKLPIRWQHVIKLRFQEQLPVEEIAAILSITPNAAHQLVHRAVRQLRQLLSEPEGLKEPEGRERKIPTS